MYTWIQTCFPSHLSPTGSDVGHQRRDRATYRTIPCPLISCWATEARWTSELHYIMTGEVIRQCSEVWWTAAMSPFFSPSVRKPPLLVCEADSAMSLKCLCKPKSVWERVWGSDPGGSKAHVCASLPNDLLWQMIGHKQTASKPPACPHKQTNKQRRRTNRPSGRVMAEFKMINQSSTGRDEWVQLVVIND